MEEKCPRRIFRNPNGSTPNITISQESDGGSRLGSSLKSAVSHSAGLSILREMPMKNAQKRLAFPHPENEQMSIEKGFFQKENSLPIQSALF